MENITFHALIFNDHKKKFKMNESFVEGVQISFRKYTKYIQ